MELFFTANIIFVAFLMLQNIEVTTATLSKSDKKDSKSRKKDNVGKINSNKIQGPCKATVYEKGKYKHEIEEIRKLKLKSKVLATQAVT